MDRTTRSLPVAGEFYRHFKGNLYQIIGTAYDEATMMPLVVYQALYGEYRWYVRPVAEFLSPVDKEKHPDSPARYRFERVEPADFADGGRVQEKDKAFAKTQAPQAGDARSETGEQAVSYVAAQDIEMREIQKAAGSSFAVQEAAKTEGSASWSNPEEDQVRPELLLFLDAETPAQKLAVLREIRRKIDGELMTNIELSIDLMPDEKETLERRLALVEMNLEKRAKYEGGRLR